MKTAAETRLSLNSVRKHNMLIAVCCITLNVILVSGNGMKHLMFVLFVLRSFTTRDSWFCSVDAFYTGSSPSDQVIQSPAQMFYKPQQTAKIACSHSIQDFNVILWYKASKNRQLQLLGYMLGDSEFPETGFVQVLEILESIFKVFSRSEKCLDSSLSAWKYISVSWQHWDKTG